MVEHRCITITCTSKTPLPNQVCGLCLTQAKVVLSNFIRKAVRLEAIIQREKSDLSNSEEELIDTLASIIELKRKLKEE